MAAFIKTIIFSAFTAAAAAATAVKNEAPSLPMLSKQAGYYTVRVGVGTPPQYLNLALDTGTAKFFVLDGILTAQVSKEINTFKPLRSSSFKLDSENKGTFLETYRHIHLTAQRATETVTINGFEVKKQKIELVTAFRNINASDFPKIDGVLGIGFQLGRTPFKYFDFTSPLHDYVKTFSYPVFTVYNNPVVNSSTQLAGKITFGDKDEENCDGMWFRPQISYQPQPLWTFRVNGYMLGGVGFHYKSTITLDSGDKDNFFPAEVVQHLSERWKLENGTDDRSFYIACDKIPQLSTFSIIIKYGDEIMDYDAKRLFEDAGNNRCRLNVLQTDGLWQISQNLHTDYCQYYYVTGKAVQFAAAKIQP
ncbi:unnamed protein product [Bursaphelenchus xylophilus]|uniref:(pine wood nematode) hypothetical protein n=1 Tax=Bursaphelenchus xylophilus TaxID=6326 RepID=A0A1I7SD29_BURXY|nr:unnamed protein product [Bursaphelenchus xylophilus]CAG9093036.1 unnamed protein product [Bursaphelenchus xylophilus]